jgi:hypothetical protein
MTPLLNSQIWCWNCSNLPMAKHHNAFIDLFIWNLDQNYTHIQGCNLVCAFFLWSLVLNELIYFIPHYQTPLHMKPSWFFLMIPFHTHQQTQMKNYVMKFSFNSTLFFPNPSFGYRHPLGTFKGPSTSIYQLRFVPWGCLMIGMRFIIGHAYHVWSFKLVMP